MIAAKTKELKLTDAAAMLDLGYRQVQRLCSWKRYQRIGRKKFAAWECCASLQSKQAGQISSASAALDQEEIFRFPGERFGPTLAAEHLAEEDGITMNHETLRGWMLGEGLWSRQRHPKKHCQRRERKQHFGELI